MERTILPVEDRLVDLGAVSVETKGAPSTMPEFSQEQPQSGLNQD
ncbi:benenodin family lasso peptide [Caulobacter hibisci]|uniref:Benenodin family lasso peptide n=1 Tax=Caulobacter hibisci TaxID=2035993 RepID=A0ABS0SX96_9CAUL|nr:benenodin family lasso peptide [Caulobacter hibisci]MBI1684218.1 benenodin family lasso peptide [Caulobacter hibisci]